MKNILTTLVLCITLLSFAQAQSKSYRLLKEKFLGSDNVFAIRTSGFMARTILWMAGEREYNDAIRDIRNVRLMVIPKDAFRKHDVTLDGFRKVAKEKDGFEELAHVRDNGDDVTILIQDPARKNQDNRYLLLVEENDQVVVIEVRGYIDPDLILKRKDTIAYH
jgi:hypothetical protein